jgi:hypothetical protein
MVLKAKFEDQTDQQDNAAETAAPVDSTAAATTAVATASASSALAVSGQGSASTLAALKDVVHVEWDTLTRIVADGSNLTVNDEVLGSWVEMQITSWQDSFSVETGEQSEEAKKFLKFSDDGVTLRDNGQPVAEYVKYLKEVEGYANTSVKHRVILVGFVEKAEKDSELVGQLAQISLSPQSKKSFDRYQMNATMMAKMGRLKVGDDPSRTRLTAVRTSKGPYKFTVVEVTAAK